MKPDALVPIPVPLNQHLREVRMRLLPAGVVLAAIVAIAVLWQNYVAAPTMVGQAEPVLANVSSHKPGVVAGLNLSRFQLVKAGDPLGHVLIADPRLIETSLAVIRAEIEMLRVNLSPIAAQQRNAVNYTQLRLDWMKQRATLASARVNLQLAEVELRRNEELFRGKIISTSLLDQSRATYEGLQKEVAELSKLVVEGEENFRAMQPTGVGELAKIPDDPLRAAIALQEAKLHQLEAELSPVTLRAPIDGIVAGIFHRSGESVTAGQPIVAIATTTPARIVGYLRQPILAEPKAGMTVQVRTRGGRREVGSAQILHVGSQLEAVPDVMLGPIKLAAADLGLPVDVTIPANLNIRPGELVDIVMVLSTR